VAGQSSTELAHSRREGRSLKWLVAAVLVMPSAAWIALDRSVWSWDPSHYAIGAVDLWRTLTREPHAWARTMGSVLFVKAPLIAWLGQLFVPLGEWIGSIETGLLVSVVLGQLVTLVLTWDVARKVRPGTAWAPWAGVLVVASAPLFVSMSHHFLTEAIQLLSIAYVFWVAAHAASLPPTRTALHLLLALELGLLAKLSTPVFVLFPAVLAAGRALVRWRRAGPRTGHRRSDLLLGLIAAVCAAMGAAWYAENGARTLDFARMSAFSEHALVWGHRDSVFGKLAFWGAALWKSFAAPATPWVAMACVAAAALILLVRGRRAEMATVVPPRDRLLVLAAALELAIVFAVLSRTVNEESRYLLALASALSVLLAGVLPAAGHARSVTVGITLALAIQWGVVHAGSFRVPLAGAYYWAGPPRSDDTRKADIVRVVDRTCDAASKGRHSIVGIDLDWFNGHTLTFYSSKASLRTGFRCNYQHFGLAPRELDAAWRRLDEVDALYLITLTAQSLPPATDPLNPAALSILHRAERDLDLHAVPFESSSGVIVFQRAPSGHARH
jgi:hypothetical protein